VRSSADIVIVGAGIIGVSIAHQLTARGAKNVLVLDRGAIGRGQTQKGGGFIQTHWPELAEVRMIHRSREIFRDWGERIGGDCGFRANGYLHVTGPKREAEVRRVHRMLLDEGIRSEWLEPDELQKLQPSLNVDDLTGGAYESESGWADPLASTLSLAEAGKRQGAAIIEGVTVLQIAHKDGSIAGVETTEGFISAPIVVLAIGPWTSQLHPDPRAHLPIWPKRGQVIYCDRPGGLPREELAFYDEVTRLYTHPDGDTNLVGVDWDFDSVWGPDRYRREIDTEYATLALAALAHRFPSLESARIVRGVVGLYDFTPDGQPIVDGPLGLRGYYVAAGFSGSGFKSAPMTGLAMAELILDGKASSVDIEHLRFARFASSLT
jgi:sarcosine oxidase, subunit beta